MELGAAHFIGWGACAGCLPGGDVYLPAAFSSVTAFEFGRHGLFFSKFVDHPFVTGIAVRFSQRQIPFSRSYGLSPGDFQRRGTPHGAGYAGLVV